MLESIKKYMRVGLIHFMAYPAVMRGEGPVEETLRAIAADDYFDAVEVTWIKDPEVRARAKAIIETGHLSLAYGSQPRMLTTGQNINALDGAARQTALDSLLAGVDEAYELGAEGFAFLSGPCPKGEEAAGYQALLDSTRALCARAKAKGAMRVALEVFDYDIDKKSLIGPTSLAVRFAEDIRKDYDNFGLLIDLSHIPMQHETIREAILPAAPYMIHAHMGNTVIRDPGQVAYGDTHPRFGFPGSENDVAELTAYLRTLLEVGFLNSENPPIVSFEVKPWGDESSELVIANAKRTLNRAWAMV
jgi:sugar phosphate isomerase/epimerase